MGAADLETVPLGTGQHVSDLALDEFKPVKPDLAVELDLSIGDERRRVDVLVELDRTGRPSSNVEKFRRYDALITAWSMSHRRFKALGEPPVAVFVVEDDEKALQFLRAADTVVTGRVGKWGTPRRRGLATAGAGSSAWPNGTFTWARCAPSGCPSNHHRYDEP